jgi:hypothetical protein
MCNLEKKVKKIDGPQYSTSTKQTITSRFKLTHGT